MDIHPLETDSDDYEVLYNAAKQIKGVEGFTCEIGIRRGGGSSIIMGALIESNDQRVHVGLDPYGNIDYQSDDSHSVKFDYTNQMKIKSLAQIYGWCFQYNYEFMFFNMEDTEFFNRFDDGIPVYNEHKSILNKYALVHFDGPHSVNTIKPEINFFKDRTPIGGFWVFDDVCLYDHDTIEKDVFSFGFELVEKTKIKASYKKVK